MTTTLRPTEPLQRTDGGDLSRRFKVCVNGRPVGAVHLITDPDFGPRVARIAELRIAEPDRRRGRGTVAALAAEEVARGWGCARIEASVPANADHALRMAAALGYVERNRTLSKPLTVAQPLLPEGSSGRPMSEAEFGPWLAAEKEACARTWMGAGVPGAQARAKSEGDLARLLSDGFATGNVLLRVVEHEGSPVGGLWLQRRAGEVFADVRVRAEYRGRGHGRSLVRFADAEAAPLAGRISLNVFVSNPPALALCDSLGYRPVQHQLYKPLL